MYVRLTFDIARAYLKDCTLPSDYVTSLLGYIRNRDVAGLVARCSWYLASASDADTFRQLSQIAAFFSKNVLFSDDTRCRETAILGFKRAERRCRITNRRLSYYNDHRDRLDPLIARQLDIMKKVVSLVLGDVRLFLDTIADTVRVTTGATEDLRKADVTAYLKVNSPVRITTNGQIFVSSLCKFHDLDYDTTIVDHNRVAFVPKNFKTHRSIAAEPTGLLPFQLGFDAFIKLRLRAKLGIDLSHGQSTHRAMARAASIDGKMATIDLSMASDTLSNVLVYQLVSSEWWDVLRRLRTPNFELEGEKGKYAKFSSMGNGCTFGLETLVFSAACAAVGSIGYQVYGDDIIVETQYAEPVINLLRHIGFTTNPDKTFVEGPFRESCGADFFRGVDVRPFFVRDIRTKSDLVHVVNGLLPQCKPYGELSLLLKEVVEAWRLPLGPFHVSTREWVFIPATDAFRLGLVRLVDWIPYCKGFTVRNRHHPWKNRRAFDKLRYLLWSFNAFRRRDSHVDPRGFSMCPITSEVYFKEGREQRSYVAWVVPSTPVPTHLFWWVELLSA